MKIRIIVSMLAMMFCVNSYAFNFANKTVQFRNHHGSKFTVIGHKKGHLSGTFTGTFTSAVALPHCSRIVNKARPITGFYNGNAISITVNYPSCGTILTWIGNVDRKQNFHAMWLDTTQAADPHGKNFGSRTIGHEVFQAISSQDKNMKTSRWRHRNSQQFIR